MAFVSQGVGERCDRTGGVSATVMLRRVMTPQLPPPVSPQHPQNNPPHNPPSNPLQMSPRSQPPQVPTADPQGRYRPAPTSPKTSAGYLITVLGAVVVLCLIPFFVDRALPDNSVEGNASELLTTQLRTATSWPLTFEALEQCTGDPGFSVDERVYLECTTNSVNVIGMADVQDDPSAIGTAFDRAVRAMWSIVSADVGPRDDTADAQRRVPGLLERSGADQVWMSDYFAVDAGLPGGVSIAPISQGVHRSVGFFRGGEGGGFTGGDLVVVDVVASTEEDVDRALNRVIETAREANVVSDSGKDRGHQNV